MDPRLRGSIRRLQIQHTAEGSLTENPGILDTGCYVRYEGVKYFCEMAYPWLQHPRVAKLIYADLAQSPVDSVARALTLAGVEISRERLESVHERVNFQKMAGGRDRGVEDKAAHFRKGLPGAYKEYFTEFHRAVCKRLIGPDLVDLHFEQDLDW